MRSSFQPAIVFIVIFVAVFLLHAPLLNLPYFWDEAGYYIPAARDILLSGSLIPHTTVSNAHPPLVLAWLALWWKCFGYTPAVTRSAMLLISAFSLLGVFRLAARVANSKVAVAATLCTALYPVFFAQSSLAQVDLAAAGLTFWALAAYLESSAVESAIWFSFAALAKETSIIAPIAIAAWEFLGHIARRRGKRFALWQDSSARRAAQMSLSLLLPLTVLVGWYLFHYIRTGYVFGNPEFFRYNIASTLNPLRFLLALLLRLWQAFGYMHLWLLTIGTLLAMMAPAIKDDGIARQRIAIPVQMIFLVIVAAYVISMALIGGAVLARYMLPAVPLLILIAVSTLHRRLIDWFPAIALVAAAFVAGWFSNPPYGFSPEDNLAYRDYITLHESGERFVEARYPMARVLTAWPASDELTRPWLGYVTRPMQVVRIEDFSLEPVLSAADFRGHFEVAVVFSTKYEPARPWLDSWQAWTRLKRRFFGFHRDLPAAAVAQILGGRIAFFGQRKGQWIAIIELQQPDVVNASLPRSGPPFPHARQ